MTRTNIYLTEVQMKKFKAIAEKAGYPVAEIIRRAMDEWLERYEQKPKSKSLILANTGGETAYHLKHSRKRMI